MNRSETNDLSSGSERRQDDSRITEHLASRAHETIDRAADNAREIERGVRTSAHRVADSAKASEARAKEQVDASVDKASSFVRENPLLSAGLAFTAGVVLSSLLRR